MTYIISIGIIFLVAVISQLFKEEEKKIVYDADFSKVSSLLSSSDHGYCLDGRHCESLEDSEMNAIIFGSSGSYKSAGILIPSILRMAGHSSLIINDPSRELFLKTSGALAQKGYCIKVLDYSRPEVSEGYNPFTRSKMSTSSISKMSKMITHTSLGSGNKDPFWNLSCESLISLVSLFIMRNMAEQFHTLANVHRLISLMLHSPKQADKLFIKDALLLPEYKSFIAYGDRTLSSIVATCRTALNIFSSDSAITEITSHDTVNFSDCRTTKTAIYINTTVNDQKYYSVVTSLFLQQFFAELMREIPTESLHVFFLLDESSSLYFEQLQIILANCRKYACSMLQVYQSQGQLVDIHGTQNSKAILENSWAKVYMKGQSIQLSQELETTLGKFEYTDAKGARQVRSLLTANEIHELSESLIFLGNNRAIKTKITPYFKQRRLSRLTQLPPATLTKKSSFSTAPLFEIS